MRLTLPKSNHGFIQIPLQAVISLLLVLSLAATTAYVANPQLKQAVNSFAAVSREKQAAKNKEREERRKEREEKQKEKGEVQKGSGNTKDTCKGVGDAWCAGCGGFCMKMTTKTCEEAEKEKCGNPNKQVVQLGPPCNSSTQGQITPSGSRDPKGNPVYLKCEGGRWDECPTCSPGAPVQSTSGGKGIAQPTKPQSEEEKKAALAQAAADAERLKQRMAKEAREAKDAALTATNTVDRNKALNELKTLNPLVYEQTKTQMMSRAERIRLEQRLAKEAREAQAAAIYAQDIAERNKALNELKTLNSVLYQDTKERTMTKEEKAQRDMLLAKDARDAQQAAMTATNETDRNRALQEIASLTFSAQPVISQAKYTDIVNRSCGSSCVINSTGQVQYVSTGATTAKIENIGYNSYSGDYSPEATTVACGGLHSEACVSTAKTCNSGLITGANNTCEIDPRLTNAQALATVIERETQANNGVISPQTIYSLIAYNPQAAVELDQFKEIFCGSQDGICVYSDKSQKFESVKEDDYRFGNAYYSLLTDIPDPKYEETTGNLHQPCAKRYFTSLKGTVCNNVMLACGAGGTCDLTSEAKNMVAAKVVSQDLNILEMNVSALAPSDLNKNKDLARSGCTQSKTVYVQNGNAWICWDSESKTVSAAPDMAYAKDKNLASTLFTGLKDAVATKKETQLDTNGNEIDVYTCPKGFKRLEFSCIDPKLAAFDDKYSQGEVASSLGGAFEKVPVVGFVAEHILAPAISALSPSYYQSAKTQAEFAIKMMENKPEGVTNDQIMATISPNAQAYVHILAADKIINSSSAEAQKATYPGIVPLTKEQQGVADLTLYKNMAYLSLFTSAWTENTAQSITGKQAFLNYAQTFADPNSTEAQKWGASAAFGGETALVVADIVTMGPLGSAVEKASARVAEKAPAWAAVRVFDEKVMTTVIGVPLVLTGKVKAPAVIVYNNLSSKISNWFARGATEVTTEVAEKAVVETAEEAVEKTAVETTVKLSRNQSDALSQSLGDINPNTVIEPVHEIDLAGYQPGSAAKVYPPEKNIQVAIETVPDPTNILKTIDNASSPEEALNSLRQKLRENGVEIVTDPLDTQYRDLINQNSFTKPISANESSFASFQMTGHQRVTDEAGVEHIFIPDGTQVKTYIFLHPDFDSLPVGQQLKSLTHEAGHFEEQAVIGGTRESIDGITGILRPNTEYVSSLYGARSALADANFEGAQGAVDSLLKGQLELNATVMGNPENYLALDIAQAVTETKPKTTWWQNVFGRKNVVEKSIPEESVIAKHLTGYSFDDGEKLVGKLRADQQQILTEYGLPAAEMRRTDPEKYLKQVQAVANQNGVPIKSFDQIPEKFRDKIPPTNAFYDDGWGTNSVYVRNIDSLDPQELGKLAHEVIHGVDFRVKPDLPIEFKEYRAYIGEYNLGALIDENGNVDEQLLNHIFGDRSIAGSTKSFLKESGIEVLPWEKPKKKTLIEQIQDLFDRFRGGGPAPADETVEKIAQQTAEPLVQTTPAKLETGRWTETHPQYGDYLGKGRNKGGYINNEGEVSLLFDPEIGDKWRTVELHQMEMYKKADGADGLIPKFIREIQDDNGKIIGYQLAEVKGQNLSKGIDLTFEEVQQALKDLDKLHQITGDIHGDFRDQRVNLRLETINLPDGTKQRRVRFGIDYGGEVADDFSPLISNLTAAEIKEAQADEMDVLARELILGSEGKSIYLSDKAFEQIQKSLRESLGTENEGNLVKIVMDYTPPAKVGWFERVKNFFDGLGGIGGGAAPIKINDAGGESTKKFLSNVKDLSKVKQQDIRGLMLPDGTLVIDTKLAHMAMEKKYGIARNAEQVAKIVDYSPGLTTIDFYYTFDMDQYGPQIAQRLIDLKAPKNLQIRLIGNFTGLGQGYYASTLEEIAQGLNPIKFERAGRWNTASQIFDTQLGKIDFTTGYKLQTDEYGQFMISSVDHSAHAVNVKLEDGRLLKLSFEEFAAMANNPQFNIISSPELITIKKQQLGLANKTISEAVETKKTFGGVIGKDGNIYLAETGSHKSIKDSAVLLDNEIVGDIRYLPDENTLIISGNAEAVSDIITTLKNSQISPTQKLEISLITPQDSVIPVSSGLADAQGIVDRLTGLSKDEIKIIETGLTKKPSFWEKLKSILPQSEQGGLNTEIVNFGFTGRTVGQFSEEATPRKNIFERIQELVPPHNPKNNYVDIGSGYVTGNEGWGPLGFKPGTIFNEPIRISQLAYEFLFDKINFNPMFPGDSIRNWWKSIFK